MKTRTYRYESPEYGPYLDGPRLINIRLRPCRDGYTISYRYNGQLRFRSWPGIRGGYVRGTADGIFKTLREHNAGILEEIG